MLDISQYQLFVAPIMWTKSLLCSFCKCLNYLPKLNLSKSNSFCKQTSHTIVLLWPGYLFWNSYPYLIIQCCMLQFLSGFGAPLQCCRQAVGCCRLRSYWPWSLQSVSGCMSAVCILHSCRRQLYSGFHRIMHWYSLLCILNTFDTDT